MFTLVSGAVLYVYFLGPWMIGPFTDLKSCEDARTYQIQWGINDVTPCDMLVFERSMERDETGGAPLTPQEAEKRRRP